MREMVSFLLEVSWPWISPDKLHELYPKLRGSVGSGHPFLLWLHLLEPSLVVHSTTCHSRASLHVLLGPSRRASTSSLGPCGFLCQEWFFSREAHGWLSHWLQIFNQMTLPHFGLPLSSYVNSHHPTFPSYLSASCFFLALIFNR